ncbi:c-type cytochrome [Nocardioides sp. MJB4]|uniref:Cytochrome bc1 complex cytochrome c subunit n=2 Tax=Nocardioides donggukensis TaxID=2774019 RepID=A0A927K4V2_9ACTN|nr:c-type cytochrome [Nocardioides donggukensis]MBD8869135.1 c-type cytochrome [Nocardioides donggukensis]
MYAAFSPANASRTTAQADEQLIQEGRELFLVGCSFCHGQNGEGVRSDNGQLGPSLVGVGAASVDFQVGTGRMPMQQPGQQAAVKKKAYTDEETEALAAYVASLGPGPAIPEESEYTLDGLSEDERREAVVNGGQLFLTNCSACHNFEGSGGAMPQGKVALPLRDSTEKHIYEAMITGPQQMPVFADSVLGPEDKASIIAFLESTKENPDYGGFEMGGLGPVSEGMFAWLVGIGSLVGFAYWIAAHSARSKRQETSA